MRAWLMFRVVQPTKKCTNPARAKAMIPQAVASASAERSSVTAEAIASTVASTSCRKVEK